MFDEVPSPLPTPRVPEVAEGWEIGPPDFVGVGAMKSGTTWWWSVLTGHEDVVARDARDCDAMVTAELYSTKEVHFFDRYGQVEAVDPVDYHRHFPRPAGTITGEWTPRYMYDFWTPPMLRATAPQARLLVILRDPVERYISGLTHWMFKGAQMSPAVRHQHLELGLYWQQLTHLLTYFDRDKVLILQYEQCVADLAVQAKRTFQFLGLDPDRWAGLEHAARPVGHQFPHEARLEQNPATRDALRHAYAADTERLLAEFPELDGDLWASAR